MKNNIKYRHPGMEDIENLVELEKSVWGKELAADREKWISRISIFPEGTLIAEKDNNLVGVVVVLLLKWNYPENYYPTWGEATAEGYITNHDEAGDVVYGVDMAVLPGTQAAATRLIRYPFELRAKRKIPHGMLGGRIPILSKFALKNKDRRIDKELVLKLAKSDPTVVFFLHNGFKIATARENYFPEDKESLGWGIVLEVIK